MQISTKDFKNATNTILTAVTLDKSAANLELHAKDNCLRLSVTNKEYYVSIKFELEKSENFRVVVDANLFLDLISGLTTETFELTTKDNALIIKAGKSQYKIPIIYENSEIMQLPVIQLTNKTVEMTISNDILKSILNVNSKEILKVKNLDVDEFRKLYYIDQNGCFTYTTGACLNNFTLEKPIKLLLNDKVVKLFKLFDSDVYFSYGCDFSANGTELHKVVFETAQIYLAALVTCDQILINKFIGPCEATKSMIQEHYTNHVVISVNELLAAVSRIMLFSKNSFDNANIRKIIATIELTDTELIITDELGNTEAITIENGSYTDGNYKFKLNISDLKLITDTYKNEHITINCGNGKSVVITHESVNNLLPEQAA